MKKLILLFLLSISFTFSSYSEDNSNRIVDSVFISINHKVRLDTCLNTEYKDTLVLFQSGDTTLLLENNRNLALIINGEKVSGKSHGKKRENYFLEEFSGDNGMYVKVKIVNLHSKFSFFNTRFIIFAISLVAIIILIVLFKRRPSEKNLPIAKARTDGDDIVHKLEELGYFKFTSLEVIQNVKSEMTEAINDHNILFTPFNEDMLEPYDYRLYYCDEEDLYKEEGLTSNLETIKHAFTKRGLKLDWKDETYDLKDHSSTHSISINGKTYNNIYIDKDKNKAWGMAAKYFFIMMNEQLSLQGSDELLYPISGGNDGQYIILTKEQFDYISTLGLDEEFKPWVLEDWIMDNKL